MQCVVLQKTSAFRPPTTVKHVQGLVVNWFGGILIIVSLHIQP